MNEPMPSAYMLVDEQLVFVVVSWYQTRCICHSRKLEQEEYEHLQRCSVCDSTKIFLTSKFSYLLLSNPKPIKLRQALQRDARLLIRKEPTQSNQTIQPINSRFQTLLCLHLPWQTVQKCSDQNHFAKPNQHVFTFLHVILICRFTY